MSTLYVVYCYVHVLLKTECWVLSSSQRRNHAPVLWMAHRHVTTFAGSRGAAGVMRLSARLLVFIQFLPDAR